MGKKKTEMAMKARTEIAEYIASKKADRARIRVEHIILEDHLVEAFEILEMYCDLLLARFGLIEQMKTLNDGLAEAVISIMWAAPRLANDGNSRYFTISDRLTIKYGKPFAEAARANQLEFPAKVAPKLISKLSVAAPPKYMIEIAASIVVPFTPDPNVMRNDEVAQAEKMLIDFKQAGTTTNVTDATQPVILPVPSSGSIPPAAPPSDGVNYGWIYYGLNGKSLTYPTLSQWDVQSVPGLHRRTGYPCTCPGCLLGHNIWATAAGAGVIPQFAGALLAPTAHPVPSAPPPNTY
ncbi:unnamed protein product [Cylicocyclus nassatus]|uniref:IST1 homolog n=1 Tax=Cylicocyclus nassatus TaxID=53992 RepID=A0AA36DR67_CYLNA|nr:unnamed protein product [Cylicocyclus nassatus]